MKNRKAFYLTNILFKISIVLLLINIGFVHIQRQNEKKEMEEAKIKICDIINTYITTARTNNERYILHLDYKTKEIFIKETEGRLIEKTVLPQKLYYATVFKDSVSDFTATITHNGNITPSFSIYIFDYKKIARYRISFYGFQTIKFLKINIYKNNTDKRAIYNNIVSYHNSINKNKEDFDTHWRRE